MAVTDIAGGLVAVVARVNGGVIDSTITLGLLLAVTVDCGRVEIVVVVISHGFTSKS